MRVWVSGKSAEMMETNKKKGLAQCSSNISGQSFIHCYPLFIRVFFLLWQPRWQKNPSNLEL